MASLSRNLLNLMSKTAASANLTLKFDYWHWKLFFDHNFFPFCFRAKRSSIWYYNQSLGRTSVQPRQSTVLGKSVLRNSTNSSSKCPFHQVTTRNPQMWLMAQMKACDMPMKKCISLCLPGQVDGHVGLLQHDKAGA